MTDRHINPEDFDLYALGALDGEDKQRLEEHVRACSACRQELASARNRALLLGLAAPPLAPPSSVKTALMQRIHSERPAGVKQAGLRQPRRKSWGLRFSLAFAAAAVLLAFAAVLLWKQNQQRAQQIEQLQAQLHALQTSALQNSAAIHAVNEVIAAPDTIQVTLQQQAGGPPGQAHVLYNARMGTMVYSGQIAPAPAGSSYQLWLVPSAGAPVDAGVIAADQQNGVVVVHLKPGTAAKAFAVTKEPQGGRPQPTGPKVLVGAVSA